LGNSPSRRDRKERNYSILSYAREMCRHAKARDWHEKSDTFTLDNSPPARNASVPSRNAICRNTAYLPKIGDNSGILTASIWTILKRIMASVENTKPEGAIRSMTAFARAETSNEQLKCVVELRSLNHRFQETSLRIPFRDYGLEMKIKEMISEKLERGFVELALTLNGTNGQRKKMVADENLIDEFVQGMEKIKQKHSLSGEPDLSMLLSVKDAIRFEEEETDNDERSSLIEQAVKSALDQLVEMRLTEGGSLQKDVLERLDDIERCTDGIIMKRDEQADTQLGKLKEKIGKILADMEVDPQRLLTEAAILAERSDISEEITRLKSHMEQLRGLIDGGGSIGRKVEFILQEINREANTISSKSSLYGINRLVVEMKSNIEKLREQAANIE